MPDTSGSEDQDAALRKKKRRKRENKKYYDANAEDIRIKSSTRRKTRRKEFPEILKEQDRSYRVKLKSTWEGHAAWLVRTAKHRAERKKMSSQFGITQKWVYDKIVAQDHCCRVTGRPFDLNPERSYHPWQPSLDRINNNLGYTKRNTRVVCLMYNLARNNSTDEEIVEFASYLVAADKKSK